MPYRDAERQRNAMVPIMRKYRKREQERQTLIEQALKQSDSEAWKALYATKRRRTTW